MEQFSHVFCILGFFFFLYKKISGDSTLLTQKERCPKKYPNLFFESTMEFSPVSHTKHAGLILNPLGKWGKNLYPQLLSLRGIPSLQYYYAHISKERF